MSVSATAWQGRPLGQVADVLPPEPTVGVGCIVYPGARHIFMGEPESGKTIAAYATALEELRSHRTGWVALVDFEMGPELARQRFREMGATDDELDRIVCFTPDTAPKPGEVADVLLNRDGTPEPNPMIVIYDAWAGASALLGLDDGKRADIERFACIYVVPLWSKGITTIVLDHVTKSREGRGRWAIGSERKLGVVDVALGFEIVKQMSRGHNGLVRIVPGKDRFGYLPRERRRPGETPTAAMLDLRSDPDTHAITWTWKPPAASDHPEDAFRPTVLMGRVSAFVQKQDEPVSRSHVERNVKGQAVYVRQAIDYLLQDGYLAEQPGARRARNIRFVKPYATPSDPVATPSDEVTPLTPSPPLQGDGDGDAVTGRSER